MTFDTFEAADGVRETVCMRALVQRVGRAKVTVGVGTVAEEITGEIGAGMLAFIGVTHSDTDAEAVKLAAKIWNLRIFDDDNGVMNRSVVEGTGAVLVVSQFTLYGDTRKGRRPGYSDAARPEVAEPLVERVVAELVALGARVAIGRFGADMAVELVNDGPITLSVEV
ncbi:MAG: D-tyrosyl-tRNA(Tyr) deacylase [Candidatus Aldehydirespiratoraceae bacterium]